jgi:succinoglycan biosynthesis protein ExoA
MKPAGRQASPSGGIDPARILVAVPALDEERHIEACLLSLMRPEAEMAGVRIVVADGGSRDRTRTIVARLGERFPAVELIANQRRLQSAGVNRVVALCAAPTHDILVRCDAHSVYPPRYVLDVAESLVDRNVAALSTPMDAVGAGCFQAAAAWLADTRIGSGGSLHRGGRISGYVDHGHHAGIRLDWFRSVGGYDESLGHNEDADLDHRITRAGGRIWLDARIRVAYSVRETLPGLARQYWNYGIGRARTFRKHGMKLRARQFAPPLLLTTLVGGLALAPLSLLGLLPALAYGLVITAVSLVGAARLRSPCGLWAGPAMAAMHLPWAAGFWRELARQVAADQSTLARSELRADPSVRNTAGGRIGMSGKEKWSAEVTAHSDALDLEDHVFESEDPKHIAASLKRSAEESHRRKAEPFRSAMSMLTFYINRAGSKLPDDRRKVLDAAKVELRRAFGRDPG